MLEGTLNTQIKAPTKKDTRAQVTADTDLPIQDNPWRSFWATPTMMHYNRLIVLVMLVNLAVLVCGITQGWWQSNSLALATISNLVIGNLSLAILIRQQYVINLLFKIATSVPKYWPLSMRRVMGKVYHFGG